MSTYIIVSAVFVPIYLIYNYRCYKKNQVSYWITQGMLWEDSLKVIDSSYYDFQYKSCIKSCVLLCIIIILGTLLDWEATFLIVFLISFHGTVSMTKHLAFKKNYLLKSKDD
ncbi:hypothetical protein KD33_11590 [Clostridium sp. NCR]|nr:hypothetical protein KD33_11590 [Clostridium sp. NCR]